jgi:hypothetical protein
MMHVHTCLEVHHGNAKQLIAAVKPGRNMRIVETNNNATTVVVIVMMTL